MGDNMKNIKYLLFFILSIASIFLLSIKVNADIGPKPFIIIEITGMEDKSYTATLISKEAKGPNFFYEEYLEWDNQWMEYHPIMEYEDSEGYKWIGSHWEMYGDGELKWGYYPPDNFKLLIVTEDNQYYTSKAINRYAFGSYFKVDVSKAIDGDLNVKFIESVEKNYNYWKEILSFSIRLILTIAIEIGLALIFGFRKIRELLLILKVNIITQIFLNALLNIVTYFHGQLIGLGLYIIAEVIVLISEILIYYYCFKDHKLKAVFYGLLANVVTFGVGYGLYILEQF